MSSKQELMEQYGGIALEKQLYFGEIVGSLSWEIDIQKGIIKFGDKLTFPIQILGTFSYSDETWLWIWSNEQSRIPENIMKDAIEMKKYGEDKKIEFLYNNKFEIDKTDLHLIGSIALGMFDKNGYYLADYGQGTMCVTIKSDEICNSKNEHYSILTVFPQLISLFELNHRNAFFNYLKAKGYEVEERDNILIGKDRGKTIIGEFDGLSRLINLKG